MALYSQHFIFFPSYEYTDQAREFFNWEAF